MCCSGGFLDGGEAFAMCFRIQVGLARHAAVDNDPRLGFVLGDLLKIGDGIEQIISGEIINYEYDEEVGPIYRKQ